MVNEIPVSVSKVDAPSEGYELVLRALDGTGRVWKKHFDSVVFLATDAESLNLLHREGADEADSTRLRLRREASVQVETLVRLHFTSV